MGGLASGPVSSRSDSQLVLLAVSPVSFVRPSRWPPSSSTLPPNSSSTSFDLVSLSTSGSSTQLDSLNSTVSTSLTIDSTGSVLDSTLDSTFSLHAPSSSSGGSVGSLGWHSSPSCVPTGFLDGFWSSWSSSTWSWSVSTSSTSTYRLISLSLSPSSRMLRGTFDLPPGLCRASARSHVAVLHVLAVSSSSSSCSGYGGRGGGSGDGAG
ncbi:hypothetical protein BDN67DRAFT_1015935 [Paxillus ammoniavirescens]|nr:hypothetical protein BDN67DRAFT_1015935 [Paxillus ammoniavirescens]